MRRKKKKVLTPSEDVNFYFDVDADNTVMYAIAGNNDNAYVYGFVGGGAFDEGYLHQGKYVPVYQNVA